MSDYPYYIDDDGFEYYDSIARDTGPWMLIGIFAYSSLCLLLLPICVSLGKKWERQRAKHFTLESKRARDFEMMIENCFHLDMIECADENVLVGVGAGKYQDEKDVEASDENVPPSPQEDTMIIPQDRAKGGEYLHISEKDGENTTDDNKFVSLFILKYI